MYRKALYEQVIETLIIRIKEGFYKAGKSLPPEHKLAKEFEVSRNSIREALKCLATAGILTSKSGKGSFLADDALQRLMNSRMPFELSGRETLLELLEVRLIIEPEACEIAAEKAKAEQLEEMAELLLNAKTAMGHKDDFGKAGLAFHNLISRMTGNRVLIKVVSSISDELIKSREYINKRRQYWHKWHHDHSDIYEAIRNKKASQAKRLMKKHIEESKTIYLY